MRNLKPAAQNLAAATPSITKTFDVVNRFANMLGYNPGNTEHGYLWWLAWLDHNVRTLFSVQDANGDFRPLFLQASCATYTQLVDGVGSAVPGLGSSSRPVQPHADPHQRGPVPGSGRRQHRGLSEVRGQQAEPGQHRVEHRERRGRRRGQGARPFDPKLPVK